LCPGKYKHLLQANLSSRPEESWACGPPKVMKNASVRHPRFMDTVTLSLSSRPERRDLRFPRPFVEMFFDRGSVVERVRRGKAVLFSGR
jgi:hypothetical protein